MKFHHALDGILGTRTKVRLLRAFCMYPEKDFSESDLQRIAGIPQASVHRNVNGLLENGLLERRRAGKTNLYVLNREHVLIPPIQGLFAEERDLMESLKDILAEEIAKRPEVKLAVLYGSLVEGRERADSDLDILVVTEGEKAETEDGLASLSSLAEAGFGNPVSLLVKGTDELEEFSQMEVYKEIKKGLVILQREGFRW